EDGIRDFHVTGVQTCALPISQRGGGWLDAESEEGQQRFADDGLRDRHRDLHQEGVPRVRQDVPEHDGGVPGSGGDGGGDVVLLRSEERRVGKEGRSRWSRAY